MERIREGQTLEWAVESLEHATAKDIFVYIFNSSLSLLDPPTRKIFRSMALLSTWTSIETISAMNAEVAAIPDRLSDLVKYSLVEDNLKLAPGARRYQLHPFTRYLASQELLSIDDKGAHIAKNALRYYLNNLLTQKKVTPAIQEYLEMEFANIQEVVRFASTDVSHDLVDECIQVLKALKEVDLKKGMMLLPYLVEASRRTGNQKPALQLLGIIGNPYFSGTPVRDPSMFFGREDLLGKIQESFDRNPSSAIAITGPRRVGKTSLLYQLHSHWRDNHYWVHIDLQAFLLGEGIAPLLLGIIHEINDELNSRGIRDKEMSSQLIVDEVDFKRRPLLAFAHYIRNVHHFLGDAHLVLLFDEFDLISRFINEDSSGDFSNWLLYLRALVNEGALGIITA